MDIRTKPCKVGILNFARYFNLIAGDYMWLLEYFLKHYQDIDTLSKNPEYRV
jgi:hypothetical protein